MQCESCNVSLARIVLAEQGPARADLEHPCGACISVISPWNPRWMPCSTSSSDSMSSGFPECEPVEQHERVPQLLSNNAIRLTIQSYSNLKHTIIAERHRLIVPASTVRGGDRLPVYSDGLSVAMRVRGRAGSAGRVAEGLFSCDLQPAKLGHVPQLQSSD